MEHKCKYCSFWIKSNVIKRLSENDEEESINKSKRKIKRKKKHLSKKTNKKTINKSKNFKRRCAVNKKVIDDTSKCCKNFSPIGFYCDNYGYLKFIQCINRRRNTDNLKDWSECSKCRQFELEIKDIINTYFVEGKKIINPSIRKIKRRKERPELKQKQQEPTKRIKRRSNQRKKEALFKKLDQKSNRKIKRRVKTSYLSVRKIKRRKS